MAAASNYPGPNPRIMLSVGASFQDVQIFFPPDVDPGRKLGALAALVEKLDQEAPGLISNYVQAKASGNDPASQTVPPGWTLSWQANLPPEPEPEPAAAPASEWGPEEQAPAAQLAPEAAEAAAERIQKAAEADEIEPEVERVGDKIRREAAKLADDTEGDELEE